MLRAQDVIVEKNNQRRTGLIQGVSDGKIKIKVGPVETTVALDQVTAVKKAAPKAFTDGIEAWNKGNAQQALTLLKPVAENFRSLPTPWAERASALLGDIYLSLNQIPNAETAFADFQKAYPDSTSLSDIGLARLAVEKKDFATAKEKVAPIIAESQSLVFAPEGKNAMYGQAFYIMGIVEESEGKYPEALRDYLSTVTLFSEDEVVATKARERADILIKDKQVIVP